MADYISNYTGEEIDAGIEKANTALQEHQTLKTINNQSILGSGNITIQGGEGSSISIGDSLPSGNETLWIDTSKSNITSYLKTLKVGVLGDSITYGYGSTAPYPTLLRNDFGSVTNYGVSATLIGTGWGSNAMCQRYVNMADDLDVIIVMGGTNDFAKRAEMGTDEQTFGSNDKENTNTDTFYGALNVLMQGLINKYPGKLIVFCTPPHIKYGNYSSDTVKANGQSIYGYREAIIDRCIHYSIPYIDITGGSGLDIAHNATIRSRYVPDGCHPNNAGHEVIYKYILSWLKNRLEVSTPYPVVLKYKVNDSWNTITDRYQATSSSKTLSRIEAVYTQGSTLVYPSTSLDSLKSNLIVTAYYTDGSSIVIPSVNYVLSGTLSVGQSTITASYGGKTATFTVEVTQEKTLSNISATYTQGSKIVYPTDSLESLKDDLVVFANYSDGSTETIMEGYSLSGSLSVGTSTITVSYQSKTTTFEVNVTAPVELISIDTMFSQTKPVYPDTDLDDLKSDLTVIATYSDSTTREISASEYTLSGELTLGVSSITATYQEKSDNFNVTVTKRPVLVSINAVYTQGSQVVYPSDSLDVLKQNLVVTGTYDDESTQELTEYTLSGTLTVGVSTITVAVDDLTDTFEVMVTDAPYIPLEFLAGNRTSTSDGAYINTGVYPDGNTKIEVEYNFDTTSPGTATVFGVYGNNNYYFDVNTYSGTSYYSYSSTYPQFKPGIETGSDFAVMYNIGKELYINNELRVTAGGSAEFTINQPLYLFALNNKGSMTYCAGNEMKIKYVKIWDGDTLVRHFVAAKSISDNTVGMYDLVSNIMYGSASSKPFNEPSE